MVSLHFAMLCTVTRSDIPLGTLKAGATSQMESISKLVQAVDIASVDVVVVCRRGNDSRLAVRILNQACPNFSIYDIRGGLYAWAKSVDADFPLY